MKTVPIGDGFLFATGTAVLTFLLPSHTEGWCFPPSEGERRPKDGEPMVFLSIAKKYSTGIFFTVRSKIAYRRSPRVRTPAAYFKAHSRPFGNPFSRSPFMTWPSKSATALWENAPPGHFLIPQGELRTAGASSPALPFKLGLRCEWQLYGTTASRVVVFYGSGAQCGSTTCFCGAHLRARAEREGHSHIA